MSKIAKKMLKELFGKFSFGNLAVISNYIKGLIKKIFEENEEVFKNILWDILKIIIKDAREMKKTS